MPNLVGIGNSQVPTNAMLGGLAYQDSVGEIDLEKIKARTSDTAKDIFVYDTRKDSDGGAWRKRATTQSWYNEGVGQYRGARKEFPAVAIIVVEASVVTIYDADDPTCPMWMKFTQSTTDLGAMVGYTSATIRCCTMLNGILMVGLDHTTQGNVSGLRIINFISERFDWKANITGRNSNQHWPIIDRNGGRPFGINDGQLITDEFIIDVAATVLPNTPVDESIGIPNPTIAVATRQSLSIIKHDRTVINKQVTDSEIDIGNIAFTSDGKIIGTRNHYNYVYVNDTLVAEPSTVSYPSQFTTNINYFRNNGTNFPPPYSPLGPSSITGYGFSNQVVSIKGTDFALADTYGLSIFSIDRKLPSTNNLVTYVTKDFNTGNLIGDIRGTYLCDTTAETISKSSNTELLTNGSDWTGASGTTAPNGWTSFGHAESAFTIDSGRLKIGNGASNNMTAMHQNITTVVGTTYTLYFDYELHSSAQYLIFRAGTGTLNGGLGYFYGSSTSNTSYMFTFVATGTSTNISVQLQATSGNAYGWVDNMSVKAVGAADRSAINTYVGANGANGLGLYGTLTKSAVAAGAELVGYSGFSNSNYLYQPYNAELNFGTGDLCIMFWAKFSQNNAYDDLIHRRAHNGSAYTGTGWYLQMGSNNNIVLKDSATNASRAVMDGDSTYGYWQHFCFVRRNNVGYSYKNGIQGSATTPAWTENLDNTAAVLTIGRSTISGGGDADKTSLALVRFSATAPSDEQIKKMYEDEKCLFHENAKCTFYGTSDDVNTLAFDDSNDILHVGTSSGRSEFQGLNRINNTTTAVTTVISASNELVAEQ